MSSYFYLQADKNSKNADFIDKLNSYAQESKQLVYILSKPLGDKKYSYKYPDSLIVLSPKSKIALVDCGNDDEGFQDFIEDLIEDISSISDKFLYKDIIGRSRTWRNRLVETSIHLSEIKTPEKFFQKIRVQNDVDIKKLDLLISLLIGSINDVDRVKGDIPESLLDKVKQKIQLFDGDQTRFVYENPNKNRIRIQGLSGTGKTELLLHKLKDLYVNEDDSKIYFTCHNKILADTLMKRIPTFFNFMKVEQQIEWNSRLWCTNAWGSASAPNSGAYSFICNYYGVPFSRYSYSTSFSQACRQAIDAIKSKNKGGQLKFAFTYMLIDESQDFDENFFELCELVTERNIYIAGDIFQSIFDVNISNTIRPDFLLGKCYRTDPKTLMFAHALGMGLFETNKLRWLEEKEWRDCGYDVEVKDHKFYLSREPIRRFEDVSEEFESIEIVESRRKFSDDILSLIEKIRMEHSTVQPDDIGIILLDKTDNIYQFADILEIKIQQAFGWAVNKAYESKEKKSNTILVSNRNNVKGLEFPFVICVTSAIKDNAGYRNSIYTMLSRSFIKSILLISDSKDSGLTSEIRTGLKTILAEKKMIVKEPTAKEKKNIATRFEYKLKKLSHYDLMMEIFAKLNVERKYHARILQVTQDLGMVDSDEETLSDLVQDTLKYLIV